MNLMTEPTSSVASLNSLPALESMSSTSQPSSSQAGRGRRRLPQAEVGRRAALAAELKLTKANEKLAKTAAKHAARKNKRPRL